MRKFGKVLSVSLVVAGIALIVTSFVVSQSYGKTTAEIISTVTSEVGFDVHSVKYSVDGVEYIGSRTSSGESVGDSMTVFYDKNNPAMLETPSTQLVPIACFLMGLGLVVGIFSFFKKKGRASE